MKNNQKSPREIGETAISRGFFCLRFCDKLEYMDYEAVIGLEIHAELKTRSKMFCGCLNDPAERHPNVNVCPICLGHPGVLPVINSGAVRAVLKTGLALDCRILERSKFDRKNYFYPDLPKGYQISQYDAPLCGEGYLEISSQDEIAEFTKSQISNPKSQTNTKYKIQNTKYKKIRIRRVHLEEDTGRLVHPEDNNHSLVDFNRAGVPLMELVTEPDIRSGGEARRFAEELQLILKYLGVSDADMERGQMRVEANISLRPKGAAEFGTKVEIKNLNSFKAIERAIDFEIKRQEGILSEGGKISQETRGWNVDKEKTFSQRSKEGAHDYRYFPEPDLPPLKIGVGGLNLDDIRAGIGELPAARRARFGREFGLPPADIEIFTVNKALGDYFEAVVSELAQVEKEEKHEGHIGAEIFKTAANYLISDFQNMLKETGAGAGDSRITPENFAEFIRLIHGGKISSRAAKDILKIMFETGGDPSQIMEERNLSQVSDASELENWVRETIKENPGPAEDFKKGKTQALQFLVGQTMKKSQGKANPQIIQQILQKLLTN